MERSRFGALSRLQAGLNDTGRTEHIPTGHSLQRLCFSRAGPGDQPWELRQSVVCCNLFASMCIGTWFVSAILGPILRSVGPAIRLGQVDNVGGSSTSVNGIHDFLLLGCEFGPVVGQGDHSDWIH